MTADDVAKALRSRHAGIPFFEGVKNGPTWYSNGLAIMDAIAVEPSWAKPCITGYEIKVSRADFLADQKWPGYLPLCHRLYFACPRNLIKPSELGDPRVGLVYVNDTGKTFTRVKAGFRNIDLPTDLLYYLVVYRCQRDGLGVSLDARESRLRACREWLEGKADCQRLGWALGKALPQRLVELEAKVATADRAANDLKDALAACGVGGLWALRDLVRDLNARTGNIDARLVERAKHSLNQAEQCLSTAKGWLADATKPAAP